ncbi:hypothetical protein M0G43_15540 [Subsaxibacter sp. CAU 1640]|uniref:hypothetical protein n=1 Tax=Subsaxibacter sp. CAU 1640 TaxID=2933271 RepID=UPI002003505A|nr:hypothetical protein [Subsaxibacter sp. CAU 1640]MCK7592001.1 hypothetical protein [Subsaxibacter sp. CAU 1640]
MNKTIKTILMVVGVVLIAYGVYKVIVPEASVDIGVAEFEAQDNNDAYITIGLGLAALVLGFLGGRKSS